MAAVAAPKICRERERKEKGGKKEKRGERKEREEKKERKGEESKRERCIRPIDVKHPLRTDKRHKKRGRKKTKKKKSRKRGRRDRKGWRKHGDKGQIGCEKIGSVFYSSIKPYLS